MSRKAEITFRPDGAIEIVGGSDPFYVNYHMAALFNKKGGVSALCYKQPRSINHSKNQSWTIREDAVTCPKCKRILKTQKDFPTLTDEGSQSPVSGQGSAGAGEGKNE